MGARLARWSESRSDGRPNAFAVAFVTTMMLLAGLALHAPAANAVLGSPLTQLMLDGEAAAAPTGGNHYTFGSLNAGTRGEGVTFAINDPVHNFQVWFAPISGQPLTVGTYENAQRYDFRAAGHPGMELFGDGVGCNTVSARFIVDQISLDGGGVPLVFSARFEYHCDGGEPAVFGALSFNATADFRDRSLSVNSLDFGPTVTGQAGAPQFVSITNNGPSSLSIASNVVTGADAGQFAISSSTCAAATLSTGQSCTIGVTMTPVGAAGARSARLTVFDDIAPLGGGGTGRDVQLNGTVVAAPNPVGEFTALSPERFLDTRTGTGHLGALPADSSLDVQIAGRGQVPSAGVQAVVLNATVANPTAPSFLTIWPSGVARPQISNLNFVAGQTLPNLVTVALGVGGKISVYNAAGTADVLFDVVGFYSSSSGVVGSRFHPLTPARDFDTRDGTGGVPVGLLGPNTTMRFKVTGKGGVPASGVTAVVMNITVTRPTAASYLTVYPDDVVRPVASNLNYGPGLTVPNLVVARVPATGVVDFFNFEGTTDLIADVVGYYDNDRSTEAGRFIAITPLRRFDSRISSPFPPPGTINGGSALLLRMPSIGGLPATGISSVVANLTATQPTQASYLTAFPPDQPLPNASNLNFEIGQTTANLAIVKISTGPPGPSPLPQTPGWIAIFNRFGATHIIVDLFGYFTAAS